jgi:hypothetical protein
MAFSTHHVGGVILDVIGWVIDLDQSLVSIIA